MYIILVRMSEISEQLILVVKPFVTAFNFVGLKYKFSIQIK